MTKTGNYSYDQSPSPNRLNKRNVAIGGVAVLAAVVGVTEARHLNNVEQERIASQRLEAVKSIDHVDDSVIVLKSGAKLRLTPSTNNGSSADGSPGNVAEKVPHDQALVIRMGMTSREHPGWMAITEPGFDPTDMHSPSERSEHTYWINSEQLQAEGYVIDTGLPGTYRTFFKGWA